MTMTVHVSQLVRGCVCQLRQIKTIRKFSPTSAAVILVNSCIVFRVDYYNSIHGGSTDMSSRSDTVSAKLRCRLIIWSDIIRSICCETTYTLVACSQRIAYRLCLITYKALNDRRMSDYISNFFIRVVVADTIGCGLLRKICYLYHGLLRSLATVPSLSQEPLNGTAFQTM